MIKGLLHELGERQRRQPVLLCTQLLTPLGCCSRLLSGCEVTLRDLVLV